MRTKAFCAVLLAATLPGCSPAPAPPAGPESAFFLVRHAEKADQSEDPPLTEQGRLRAESLARLLKDAGVERIYSSDFIRTRETAAPLADALDLEVVSYDPKALPALADVLLSSSGRSLIVGHSNTTPELAGLLGGTPGPPIPEDEYDRLYVLTRQGGVTTTLVLRLETPPTPEGAM